MLDVFNSEQDCDEQAFSTQKSTAPASDVLILIDIQRMATRVRDLHLATVP
ncbi:hypothetical protein WMW72_14665 [Paenibacillus filicis]|uniref:Uncharacterized protein n=1 Tax=Paenibacillus filicis TaxID=669464 RepID=A0ABU9DJV2_9BACL